MSPDVALDERVPSCYDVVNVAQVVDHVMKVPNKFPLSVVEGTRAWASEPFAYDHLSRLPYPQE